MKGRRKSWDRLTGIAAGTSDTSFMGMQATIGEAQRDGSTMDQPPLTLHRPP
jgi:hypothetical protein